MFNFQSWTKADDIRDFQIEGMSIGDSLLDYVGKDEINKKTKSSRNKSIMYSWINYYSKKIETYDAVQIWWHKKDKKYQIAAMGGIIKFNNDINSCKIKMDSIANEIKNQIKFKSSKKQTVDSDTDENGKVYMIVNYLENGDLINIQCYKFSESYKKKYNIIDSLKVMIVPKVFNDHYNEANN